MANAKRKKGRKILILTLVLLVVGGLTVAALVRKREAVITVQTEKATRRNLTELVVANGKIQPVLQVKISPEVSGEIIALPVKEGQQVKKGELLLKIKPDPYVAAVNQSEASYMASLSGKLSAAASLQRAEAEYQRNLELFQTKLVSDSTFLEAKTAFEIAKAQMESAARQVDVAKAALDRAKDDLSKTTIASPLDGTVSRLNSQLGERVVGTAMMAGTEIMTIADLNAMEARVDVGEIDVVLIEVGQKARLEVDAFKDRKFNGTVTDIANSSKGLASQMGGGTSQEATKFEVKIRVGEKEEFRPGMTVTAEIETRSRTNALTVPIASVTTRLPKEPAGGKNAAKRPGTGLQAASSNSAPTNANSTAVAGGTNRTTATTTSTNLTNGTGAKKPGEAPKPIEVVFVKDGERVKMVPVKRGISDDSYMEITDGLKEGQEVVAGGYKAISRELEEGKKVRVGAVPSIDKDKK